MIKNEWLWGAAFGGGWMIYRGHLDIGIKVLAVALLLLAIRNRWFSRIFRQVRQESAAQASEVPFAVSERERRIAEVDRILCYASQEPDMGSWDAEAFSDMDADEGEEGEEIEVDFEDDEEEMSDEEEAISAIYGSKEKAYTRVNKLLSALYQRQDKLEYINKTSPEDWAKFQKTKTWRGLQWDIQQAEDLRDRLERIGA